MFSLLLMLLRAFWPTCPVGMAPTTVGTCMDTHPVSIVVQNPCEGKRECRSQENPLDLRRCCTEAGTRPILRRGSVVALYGDSHGYALAGEFKERARASGYRPIVHTQGGTTIWQWLEWLPKRVREDHPDVVLLSLGTNDAGFWGPFLLQNPDQIVRVNQIIHEAGAEVVWLDFPEMPRHLLRHDQEVRDLIHALAPVWIQAPKGLPREADGIHPTVEGNRRWMAAIWEALSP